MDLGDVFGRHLERIAIEDDDIRKLAHFQRAGGVILMELQSSIDGRGSKHSFARQAGILSETTVIFR